MLLNPPCCDDVIPEHVVRMLSDPHFNVETLSFGKQDMLIGIERDLYYWIVIKQMVLDIYYDRYPLITPQTREWLLELMSGIVTPEHFHQYLCTINEHNVPTWGSLFTMLPSAQIYFEKPNNAYESRAALTRALLDNAQETQRISSNWTKQKKTNLKTAKKYACLGACVAVIFSCCLCLPCVIASICTAKPIYDEAKDHIIADLLSLDQKIEKTLIIWAKELPSDSEKKTILELLPQTDLFLFSHRLVVEYL